MGDERCELKMLMHYAAKRGISVETAKEELEEAVRVGEAAFGSKPREFWKQDYNYGNSSCLKEGKTE